MGVSRWSLRAFLTSVLASGILQAWSATITGFSPTAGPPGTEVTIAGSGLQTATAVLFGGQNAAGEIVSISPGSVRARVPANALTGQISVFTSASGAATSAQIFVAAPRVEEFDPLIGTPGTVVTITGANFATGLPGGRGTVTEVRFNGQPAAFEIPAINQLFAVVPTNATTGPITLVNEAGSFTTFLSFQVPGSISGFAPAMGKPGDQVEVRGRNLGNAIRVEFGLALAAFTSASPTNLIALVPTNAVNSRIQVTTPAGIAAASSNFVVLPRIISFTPAFGSAGTNVILEGGGFHGITRVEFNGVAATFTPQSSTRVSAVAPNGVTAGPITLVTTNGTFVTEVPFEVPPRITSFSPATGVRGDTVTIDGQNLGGVTRVRFNAAEATFTVVSPTRLTAVVPQLATSGPVRVEGPAGMAASTSIFTVLPVLDGFTPMSGPPGSAVNLMGSGLTNVASVRLGDLEATFTVINSTNVRAIVPLGAFSGPFRIRTAGGVEAAAPGNFFVDGAQPVLTSFSPPSGSAGTSVTLTGQGLRTAARVQFNGVDATFMVASASQVTAAVPAGATTGPIAVTTLDGIAVSPAPFVIGGDAEVALQAQRGEGTLILSWPASATDFVLQASPALGPGAVWQVVPEPPVDAGGLRQVTLPLPGTGERYFRLFCQ
jgi:hypothetical protein